MGEMMADELFLVNARRSAATRPPQKYPRSPAPESAIYQDSESSGARRHDTAPLHSGPRVAATEAMRLRHLALLVLCLGLGCSSTLTGADGGGAGACSGDTDCLTGQYCLGFSQLCAADPHNYTAGGGTCHRDCSTGACSCIDRNDCRPWEECSSGRCVALPLAPCLEEPTSCPAGCTLEQASDRICGPVCLCTLCPASDAGSDTGSDAGSDAGGLQSTD
jgi:hypothetical protein